MDKRFVSIANELFDTTYKQPEDVFKNENKTNIDKVFNILAIAVGIRSLGIIDCKKTWQPTANSGVYVIRLQGWKPAFVANKKLITPSQLENLLKQYNEEMKINRIDISIAPVTKLMNKYLGYIFPYPTHIDGVLNMILHFPDGRKMESNGYGPQVLAFPRDLGDKIKHLRDQWNNLAKAIHPKFSIEFQLTV